MAGDSQPAPNETRRTQRVLTARFIFEIDAYEHRLIGITSGRF
jgi:hypothetical protein